MRITRRQTAPFSDDLQRATWRDRAPYVKKGARHDRKAALLRAGRCAIDTHDGHPCDRTAGHDGPHRYNAD